MDTRAQMRADDRYLKTLGHAQDKMQNTDTYLDNINNILVSAKEVAINSFSATLSDEDLAVLADRIRQLKDELQAVANSQVSGKYIFAGFEETTRPFSDNQAYDQLDPDSMAVLYNGDENPTTRKSRLVKPLR